MRRPLRTGKRIEVPLDEPNDLESARKGYAALRRYCAKMATGSGKTIVMAMACAWNILNKQISRQDTRFADAVLVVGPNLTVKERLAVLDPNRADNYYDDEGSSSCPVDIETCSAMVGCS